MAFQRLRLWLGIAALLSQLALGQSQAPPSSSSSSSSKSKSSLPHRKPDFEPGAVVNGIYRNPTLGLSCRIPAGWVLRTEEMNARNEDAAAPSANDGRVLLAAFSRPPDARGEDVNSSIVIAAEPQSAYSALKEAAQYFGPLTEVAKAQGFTVDQEPYEFAVGPRTVVRSDFHKDIGTRVMRQATLAFIANGYAISITVIASTEDEVRDLVDNVAFAAAKPSGRPAK